MHIGNPWKVHQRLPKDRKRIRIKRKERMTWQEWFQDWYRALHSLGWICRNDGIAAGRVRLTEEEISRLSTLYMQKGTAVIFLYPSVETLPQRGIMCSGWFNCAKPITRAIRIVRGRRPDPKRAVVRVADGTATKLIPDRGPLYETDPFLVDFDDGLFTPTGRGDWELTKNEVSNEIYDSYLIASPHRNSFRKYVRTRKQLVPHECPLGGGANVSGEMWDPLNLLI